jgi:hypothetical protein
MDFGSPPRFIYKKSSLHDNFFVAFDVNICNIPKKLKQMALGRKQ